VYRILRVVSNFQDEVVRGSSKTIQEGGRSGDFHRSGGDGGIEAKVRTFRREYLLIHLRNVRRAQSQLIVRASTKGIGISTEATSTEDDGEVKIGKYLSPSKLTTREFGECREAFLFIYNLVYRLKDLA
jgi:hypothetical protein